MRKNRAMVKLPEPRRVLTAGYRASPDALSNPSRYRGPGPTKPASSFPKLVGLVFIITGRRQFLIPQREERSCLFFRETSIVVSVSSRFITGHGSTSGIAQHVHGIFVESFSTEATFRFRVSNVVQPVIAVLNIMVTQRSIIDPPTGLQRPRPRHSRWWFQ